MARNDVNLHNNHRCKSKTTEWNNSKRTLHNKQTTPVMNQHPERDTLGINHPKRKDNFILRNTKFNEAVRYGQKAYVLRTSMMKIIKRK